MISTINLNQINFPIQKIVNFDELYISNDIFKYITKGCTLPPIAIGEKNSELWCYSYDGYGKVTFKDGSIFTGGSKFGVLTNEIDNTRPCEINFSNGTKYIGEIKNNLLTGKGKIIFPSGSVYEGSIHNGVRHGFGVYKNEEGLIYEGEFVYGTKEGKGRMIKGDMTYEGTFHNGHIEGYGRLSWANGNQYEGEFKNDKINGYGTMYWATLNEKYTGQWKDNKENGFGIYIWYENTQSSRSLRNRYIGYWIDGVREGYGVFFYSNDTKYEGFWEHNEKNGFGVFRFKNGTEYRGEFLQDRMINYLTEGIVKLGGEGTSTYFDYNEEIDGKIEIKKSSLNSAAGSMYSTIEQKNNEAVLPRIENNNLNNSNLNNNIKNNISNNNSKNGSVVESNQSNSRLEVIMENENNKDINFKAKKKVINKTSAINKKEEKILAHLKNETSNPSLEINSLSPKKLYELQQEKLKKAGLLKPMKIDDVKVMKNQDYLASNRMINDMGTNQFLSIIDLSDIFDSEKDYEQTQTEVSNSILRNISDLTKTYFKLLKLAPNEEEVNSNNNFTKLGEAFKDINESVIGPISNANIEQNKLAKNSFEEISSPEKPAIKTEKHGKAEKTSNKALSKLSKKKEKETEPESKKEKDQEVKVVNNEQVKSPIKTNQINNSPDKSPPKESSRTNPINRDDKKYNQEKESLIKSISLNPTFEDDKIGTCLEIKDVWKFFRDTGIIGEDLSIAQFDRIFYKGKKNSEEMFLIPEELPRRNIYKFLELIITKSEKKFKFTYNKFIENKNKEASIYNKHLNKKSLNNINEIDSKKKILKSSSLNKEGTTNNNNEDFIESNEKLKEDGISFYCDENIEDDDEMITFDCHNHHNPVLLRQFYEAIIRAAYAKYYDLDKKFYQKIDLITSKLSSKTKINLDRSSVREGLKKNTKLMQRKNNNDCSNLNEESNLNQEQSNFPIPNNNNLNITKDSVHGGFFAEQKQKNLEHIKIDSFIRKYAMIIKPIFLKLYYLEKESKNFKSDKSKMIDQSITHRFLYETLVLKSDIIKTFYGKKEQYCEFITYYFKEKKSKFTSKLEQFKYYEILFDLEIIFYEFCEFVYFICNKYLISKELNIDVDDNYYKVIMHLSDVINGDESFHKKKIIKKAKFNYCFPITKAHIDKKLQQEEVNNTNQNKLLRRAEKTRMQRERQNMKINDENLNIEVVQVEDNFLQENIEESDEY